MKTIRISKQQAEEFFRNEVLFEGSRVDGFTIDDMVRLTTDGCKFISSNLSGTIIAVTAFKKTLDENVLEVHTFVLPEFRRMSVEALTSHMYYFKNREKVKYLTTSCSNYNNKVINFLKKRLGFFVFRTMDTDHTRDGKPVTVYDLFKVLE